MRGLLSWAGRRPLAATLILTFLIEAVTAFNRFGLGLRATDHTHLYTWAPFGIRLHHGYAGLVLIAAWAIAALAQRLRGSVWRGALLTVGAALALSDGLHHFVVLRLIVGSTEFP